VADPHKRGFLKGVLALGVPLVGCGAKPLRFAFLGGLTGPNADLGVGGRDAVELAVEAHNQRRGAGVVELVVFDSHRPPDTYPALLAAVQQAGVQAVVGPMTSGVATHWIPLANAAKLLTVSPTVTSSDFSGHSDWFYRVCSSTQDYGRRSAEHHVQKMGWKRVAIVRDDGNAAYTRTWAAHFVARLQSLGGELVHQATYRSAATGAGLAGLIGPVLAAQPDVVVVVANATDTANLAQLLRKQHPTVPMATSEWAATDQLIALGGRAVEGLYVAQYFDRSSQRSAFTAFKLAFQQRYRRDPGFAEVAAHDAAGVLLQALALQTRSEALRDTLERVRRFEGLTETLVFDVHGDAQRALHITRVSNGSYVLAP
jgi:branched-chain amino acid transport system substrate-binding protein